MAYTRAYGKIVRENVNDFRVHVAQWGSANCSFIMSSDQDGTEGSINYYSDIDFTTLATPFDINGEVQNWQCVYPYKSDGTPRKDFWYNSPAAISSIGLPQTLPDKYLTSGSYSDLSLSVEPSKCKIIGQGNVVCNKLTRYGVESGAGYPFREFAYNIIFREFVSFSNFNSAGFPSFTNCYIQKITGTSNERFYGIIIVPRLISCVHDAGMELIEPYNAAALRVEILYSSSYSVDLSALTGPNIQDVRVLSSLLDTYTDVDSLSESNFSNVIGGVFDSSGYISVDALINSKNLKDYTVEIHSPHFRNGGANMSANIGNSRFGIHCYYGQAPFDGGFVSDVVDSDQLLSWTLSNDVFYASKTLDFAVGIEAVKWIGAEEITTNFTAPDASFVLSAASVPNDYSNKSSTPVVYMRVMFSGGDGDMTINADNDLPAILEGIDTTNFFAYDLSTGAQYLETKLWVDGTNTIKYTEIDPESREPSNLVGLTETTLFELTKLVWSQMQTMTVEFICVYNNNTEIDLFRGLTIVPKQRTLALKQGSNDIDGVTWADNSIVTDGVDSMPLNVVNLSNFNDSTNVPFGYTNDPKIEPLEGQFDSNGNEFGYDDSIELTKN